MDVDPADETPDEILVDEIPDLLQHADQKYSEEVDVAQEGGP